MAQVLPEDQLPGFVSMRAAMPPVRNQGSLGSCTAFAAAGAWEYVLQHAGMSDYVPSTLAQYYWTRELEHTVPYDSGATIRNAIKATVKRGMAPEVDWPYNPDKFAYKPPPKVRVIALAHQTLVYERISQAPIMLRNVLFQGFPVVIGISVYPSLEAAFDGNVPMPGPDEELLGGHAIVLVGYDWSGPEPVYEWRNSWGTDWGDGGYGRIPAAYIGNSDLASDFWVMRMVEGDAP